MHESQEQDENIEGRVLEILTEKLRVPLIVEAIEILKTQVPPEITFHTVEHTLDVLHEAILFAVQDKLSEYENDLLAVAATYHDMGYIVTPRNNEPVGAKMATEAMIRQGYDKNSIETVKNMILDTAVRITEKGLEQVTDSYLAGYLLDADLSNFGRVDFMIKRELIFHDLGLKNWKEYLQESLQFLEDHRWKTPAGQKLREGQKIKNIELLKKIITSIA